jgi:primosomal replication protein N
MKLKITGTRQGNWNKRLHLCGKMTKMSHSNVKAGRTVHVTGCIKKHFIHKKFKKFTLNSKMTYDLE